MQEIWCHDSILNWKKLKINPQETHQYLRYYCAHVPSDAQQVAHSNTTINSPVNLFGGTYEAPPTNCHGLQ
jgi:hypothetical protein